MERSVGAGVPRAHPLMYELPDPRRLFVREAAAGFTRRDPSSVATDFGSDARITQIIVITLICA
jgi:hypothetical protein